MLGSNPASGTNERIIMIEYKEMYGTKYWKEDYQNIWKPEQDSVCFQWRYICNNCGNDKFYIWNSGLYETSVRCCNCRIEETIHSG